MASKIQLLYWDSCVFLSFIDAEEGRVEVIESLFEEVKKSDGNRKIVTSTVSITEVAYGSQEKIQRTVDPDILAKIDALWADSSVLTFVEYHEGIARIARDLMRNAMANGNKLTPLDAVHLASAKWLGAHELHTYDGRLNKFATMIERIICEPYVTQPRLPGT
jgi:predicted nucleic acid-binding protein